MDVGLIPLSETQLRHLCNIAEVAGHEVMAVYDQEVVAWTKGDETPVTEADLLADRVIREGLQALFPDVFICSEESVSKGGATAPERFFLVDPLDGTKEFLKRNGEFTVNIALIETGLPVAGVVLAPALGEMFYAARGLGAWKRDASGTRTLRVLPWDPAHPVRVLGSRSHGSDALSDWLEKLPCSHAFVAAGSSLKFCRIAAGQADLYPRLGPTSQWDTAAGQCVLEGAGGEVIDFWGQTLTYGMSQSLENPPFLALGDARLREVIPG